MVRTKIEAPRLKSSEMIVGFVERERPVHVADLTVSIEGKMGALRAAIVPLVSCQYGDRALVCV